MGLDTSLSIVALSKVFKKNITQIEQYLHYEPTIFEDFENSSREFSELITRLSIYLRETGTKLITYWDEEYPQSLKNIPDPPVCLFVKGKWEYLSYNLFAVVGTRKMTSYGKQVTERFVSEISKHFVIVSGMAYGVDTIAHSSALRLNRPTIAVLGCGVDVVYPKSNKMLYEQIIDNGCVVSEYLPWESPKKFTFVERNRIISGLSVGVLVTEAGVESGALITAKYAIEQGRDVFAVPGDIFRTTSQGTNYLIKSGAFVATEPSDILEYYGFKDHRKIVELTDDEAQIFGAIESEVTIEEMSEKLNVPISQVMLILTTLELKGLVYRTERNTYARAR
ncbi:MAG: DNA-processing protein DprA [Fervidobacterium pennivorans]|jgi:DNA processing protein|uniref:DNA processing protein DprA n=2 Tax=Fervidobacterium pennivorans TaxID=93466 RepID=A0A172T3S3_FERPE|nr:MULTISPECIES: DNA-processing protein DprA [Fervidobacterium]AFG35880.1 DNA protecting protein DprA [Fervidobacterium pennivorans DSM 9078]ANE41621.1 DNA processing protein DprA [Fervidobacterium pennivorans]MDM7320826.1 DNA-processing protein DprA [Fervidobacterium sp.]NPU89407.1 DNA-protecting protein DprA [Fervidobacterium sp.]